MKLCHCVSHIFVVPQDTGATSGITSTDKPGWETHPWFVGPNKDQVWFQPDVDNNRNNANNIKKLKRSLKRRGLVRARAPHGWSWQIPAPQPTHIQCKD